MRKTRAFVDLHKEPPICGVFSYEENARGGAGGPYKGKGGSEVKRPFEKSVPRQNPFFALLLPSSFFPFFFPRAALCALNLLAHKLTVRISLDVLLK